MWCDPTEKIILVQIRDFSFITEKAAKTAEYGYFRFKQLPNTLQCASLPPIGLEWNVNNCNQGHRMKRGKSEGLMTGPRTLYFRDVGGWMKKSTMSAVGRWAAPPVQQFPTQFFSAEHSTGMETVHNIQRERKREGGKYHPKDKIEITVVFNLLCKHTCNLFEALSYLLLLLLLVVMFENGLLSTNIIYSNPGPTSSRLWLWIGPQFLATLGAESMSPDG